MEAYYKYICHIGVIDFPLISNQSMYWYIHKCQVNQKHTIINCHTDSDISISHQILPAYIPRAKDNPHHIILPDSYLLQNSPFTFEETVRSLIFSSKCCSSEKKCGKTNTQALHMYMYNTHVL